MSGPTRACAASTAAVGAVASSASNGDRVARRRARRSASTTGVSRGTTAAIALPYAGPLANTRPGVSMPRMWRSLPWSCETSEYAGEIGANGTPAQHRAEREQQVLDVVVGQDRDRPLGREAAIEQRLPDRQRALQRLAVADAAPVAAVDPLGDEGALGARVAQSISRSVRRSG